MKKAIIMQQIGGHLHTGFRIHRRQIHRSRPQLVEDPMPHPLFILVFHKIIVYPQTEKEWEKRKELLPKMALLGG